jgi:predicted methyltransferase
MRYAAAPYKATTVKPMQNITIRSWVLKFTLALLGFAAAASAADEALKAAIGNPVRSASAVARDAARHPYDQLTFFGIKPDMTVVELWPGGGYWTDILGPYLKDHGHLYVATNAPGNFEEAFGVPKYRQHLADEKARLGDITETSLGSKYFDIAPAGSADLVITSRNLHNWMGEGYADKVIAASFKALKPGGILGIDEHRAPNDKPQDPKANNGYVRQDYTIDLAKKAGFEFVGASEINANPKDTKDYKQGVWALPPTLIEGDKDRAKYLAIGESDRYVLKFKKPKT